MPDGGALKAKAFSGSSVSQLIETRVGDCAIDSVVVYQDRAEVKRAVPVHLCPGENEVIVYDLAECIDKNSIRYIRMCIKFTLSCRSPSKVGGWVGGASNKSRGSS